MVILAVHVGGDAATEGGELGSRGDGWEPTQGQSEANYLFDRDSCLRAQNACPLLKIEQVVEIDCRDDVGEKTGIPVTAPAARGDRRRAFTREPGQVSSVAGPANSGFEARVVAPAGDRFSGHREA